VSPEAEDAESRTESVSDAPQARASTPPILQETIKDFEDYKFDVESDTEEREDEALALAMMMYESKATTELPSLRTEKWTYSNKKPNPVSIGVARRLLAAGYAQVPCELEGAGIHGYAWMVELDQIWIARKGTSTVTAPTMPRRGTSYSVRERWEYNERLRDFTVYNHLMQEGKGKIIEWFGKAYFVDLHVNGLLPPDVTPRKLLQHLSDTYAQPRDHRRHMVTVEEKFDTAYDPRNAVEAYFMKLQEARSDAALLGQPYTDQQVMNKALRQFETHYEKDSYKAEKKWNEKADNEKTWERFKTYWKEEIHQWETITGRATKQANQAEEIDLHSIVESINALQAETKSNNMLVQQMQFQQALQAEEQSRGTSRDDMSTITDQFMDNIVGRLHARGGTPNQSSATRRDQLVSIAKARNPGDYKSLNEGKGKQFSSYCWKCGCNCTHWTRKCFILSATDRKKYREANFDNLMGGSTKNLDRQGKYQVDFDFDSL
jgi:hypothetical protein